MGNLQILAALLSLFSQEPKTETISIPGTDLKFDMVYIPGGKATLGRISKRGNIYLRSLFIQGAQALYIHMKRDRSRLGEWLRNIEARSHRNVAIVALANKIVRICWKVLTTGVEYQPYPARSV